MTSEQRKNLIIGAQHQTTLMRDKFKRDECTIEELRAVAQAMRHMEAMIHLEFNKANKPDLMSEEELANAIQKF